MNRWTPTRKAAVILDLLRGGDAVELARKHGLSHAQLFAWRDRFLEAGHAALRTRQGRAEWAKGQHGLSEKLRALQSEYEAVLKSPLQFFRKAWRHRAKKRRHAKE